MAWPGDAKAKDHKSGMPICDEYRDIYKVQMLEKAVDQSGISGYLKSIDDKILNGKFKVFRTLQAWFDQYMDYQYGERGEILRRTQFHLMDATRYAVADVKMASPIINLGLRHSRAKIDFNVF